MVWLIDFAKSIPLPGDVKVSHRAPWVEGTHEDGYLLGLDNLISLMTLLDEQHQQPGNKITDSLVKDMESHTLQNSTTEDSSLKNKTECPPRIDSPRKTTLKTLSRHYLIPNSSASNSSEISSTEKVSAECSNESSNDIRNLVLSSPKTSSIS